MLEEVLRFSRLDVWVVIIYAFVIMANGIYQSMKVKSQNDYLLGGKAFGVFSTLCTQGASMKGASSLIGYPAGVFTSGIGVLIPSQCYNMGAWIAIAAGIPRRVRACAAKLDLRSGGDLFRHRFNSQGVKALAGAWGAWQTFVLVTNTMAAVALILSLAFGKYGITYEKALIISIVFSVIYTTAGGLLSVVANDVLQWCIMTPVIFVLLPAFCIFGHGITPEAVHSSLSTAFFSLKPNVWWTGFFISGIMAANTDICILTRYISAKDQETSVKGAMFGFAYTTLFAGATVFIGLAAAMVVDKAVLGGNDEQAIFALISRVLPHGLIGLFIAAALATMISTLDSYLQTTSLVLMVDVIQPSLSKDLTDKQALMLSRILTLLIACAAALIVLKLRSILQITYLGKNVYVSAIFVPMMACMFWSRLTLKGTVAGIVCGSVMGVLATVIYKLPLPGVWGVAVSLIATVAVSLMTSNEAKPLLPGFIERGLKIDVIIARASVIGCIGTVVLTVGLALYVNWFLVILGAAMFLLCIKMIYGAFDKKHGPELASDKPV